MHLDLFSADFTCFHVSHVSKTPYYTYNETNMRLIERTRPGDERAPRTRMRQAPLIRVRPASRFTMSSTKGIRHVDKCLARRLRSVPSLVAGCSCEETFHLKLVRNFHTGMKIASEHVRLKPAAACGTRFLGRPKPRKHARQGGSPCVDAGPHPESGLGPREGVSPGKVGLKVGQKPVLGRSSGHALSSKVTHLHKN